MHLLSLITDRKFQQLEVRTPQFQSAVDLLLKLIVHELTANQNAYNKSQTSEHTHCLD